MKITKRQQYWIEIIERSGGLFKYYNSLDNPSYQIINSTQEIDTQMAQRLLKKGILKPQGDGFFGNSQVYKVGEVYGK